MVSGGQQKSRRGKTAEATGESGVTEHLVDKEIKKQMCLGMANAGGGGFFSPAHMPNLQLGKHPLLDACHVYDGAGRTLTGLLSRGPCLGGKGPMSKEENTQLCLSN